MKKLLCVLLILTCSVAFAADKIKIRKFAGLSTRINPYEIGDNESPDMENFVLDTAGSLVERTRFKHYNSATIGPYSINNLYKFYKSSDAGFLINAAGDKLYKASGGDLTDITTAGLTIVNDSHWSFETFTDDSSTVNELVFAVNQGCKLQSWDGSASTFSTEDGYPAENCNLLKKHKARLWASGSDSYPYRIYYSTLSDGDDWSTSGGTLDLPSYEKIMAIEVLSDLLYIFTRNSAYYIVGSSPDEFSIVKSRSSVGTHATKSVTLGNNIIFFLNASGVFAFDGDQATNISETIQPTVDAMSSTHLSEAAGVYDKRGRYWLSYVSQENSYNDKVLVYDTVIKQWYLLTGNFACFLKTEGGTDKGELYAGNSDSSGWLWQLQLKVAEEQVSHSTKGDLETGVTFNTAVWGTANSPQLKISKGEWLRNDDTQLRLNFNTATDAETSTSDDSKYNHSIAFVDDAQLDTEDPYLGLGCLYLDGTLDRLTINDSPAFNLVASKAADHAYTAECWVKHDDHESEETYLYQYVASSDDSYALRHVDGNGLTFLYLTGGATRMSIAGGEINDDEWHHVLLYTHGDGTTLYANIYKDGNQIISGNTTIVADFTGFSIGGIHVGGSNLDGRMDEIVIHKGNWYGLNPLEDLSDKFEVGQGRMTAGTLISDNIEINAATQAELGTLSWQESTPDYTDIQFSVRTGTTDDSTYDTWTTPWVSNTSVSIDTVIDYTAWKTSNLHNFSIGGGDYQRRNVIYYEYEDNVSPDCVKFTATLSAKDSYADREVPFVDISDCNFIAFWLKSPCTGNSVRVDIGEVTPTSIGFITANTVEVDTWEKHYWPLSDYDSTDIDRITYLKVTYLKPVAGDIYFGDIWAYDFIDNDEAMGVDPNNYIQYLGILGSIDYTTTPKVINAAGFAIQLTYGVSGGTLESELSSYWMSKPFDNQNEYDKIWQWVEFDLESANPTTNHTVYMDWWTDDGLNSGTQTKQIGVTGRRVKCKFYLPDGTYGNNFQFKFRDTDVDDNIIVNNATISFVQES